MRYQRLNIRDDMKWNNIMPLAFSKKLKKMRAFGTLNDMIWYDMERKENFFSTETNLFVSKNNFVSRYRI